MGMTTPAVEVSTTDYINPLPDLLAERGYSQSKRSRD
jgi:hypothetical protein